MLTQDFRELIHTQLLEYAVGQSVPSDHEYHYLWVLRGEHPI